MLTGAGDYGKLAVVANCGLGKVANWLAVVGAVPQRCKFKLHMLRKLQTYVSDCKVCVCHKVAILVTESTCLCRLLFYPYNVEGCLTKMDQCSSC